MQDFLLTGPKEQKKNEFRINIYSVDYSKDGDRDAIREALKEANVSSSLEATTANNPAGGITVVISRDDYINNVFPKIIEKRVGIGR